MKLSTFHHEALAEFDAAIGFYEEREQGLGLRFHAAVQHAIEIVERHPRIGSPYKTTPLQDTLLPISLICCSTWIWNK